MLHELPNLASKYEQSHVKPSPVADDEPVNEQLRAWELENIDIHTALQREFESIGIGNTMHEMADWLESQAEGDVTLRPLNWLPDASEAAQNCQVRAVHGYSLLTSSSGFTSQFSSLRCSAAYALGIAISEGESLSFYRLFTHTPAVTNNHPLYDALSGDRYWNAHHRYVMESNASLTRVLEDYDIFDNSDKNRKKMNAVVQAPDVAYKKAIENINNTITTSENAEQTATVRKLLIEPPRKKYAGAPYRNQLYPLVDTSQENKYTRGALMATFDDHFSNSPLVQEWLQIPRPQSKVL